MPAARGRLVELIDDRGKSTRYTYDLLDRQVTMRNDGSNPDQRIARRGNGNIANDGTRIYQYDALNRVIQVTKIATPSNLVISSYTYDALGRRIKNVITNGGMTSKSALNGTVVYLYDGAQGIEERDGSDGQIRQFVWGQYIDEAVQMKTYVDKGKGEVSMLRRRALFRVWFWSQIAFFVIDLRVFNGPHWIWVFGFFYATMFVRDEMGRVR